MSIRSNCASLLTVSMALLTLSACDRATEPELDSGFLPQPATATTARTAMTATASALGDVAILAPRWAALDFVGSAAVPDAGELEPALWIAEQEAWRVVVETSFDADGSPRALRGSVLVQFLAAGVPQSMAAGADALHARVDLASVESQSNSKTTPESYLRVTGDLVMDLTAAEGPPILRGTGDCTGFVETDHEDTVTRTNVALSWTAALDEVYGSCCPSGQLDLSMGSFQGSFVLGGDASAAGTLLSGAHPLPDLQVSMPCAPQHPPRGTLLQSLSTLHAAARGESDLRRLRSGHSGEPLGLSIGDAITLAGTIDDRDIEAPPFLVGGDGLRLGDLALYLQEHLILNGASRADVTLRSDGLVQLDHTASTVVARTSTRVELHGNLHRDSDALGTYLETFSKLLAVATSGDRLTDLHTGQDGQDLKLTTGAKIALTGFVDGSAIQGETFVVGTDGSGVGDLLSWMETRLNANGASGATTALLPDGSIQVAAGTASLGNLKVASGGSVPFNQLMIFGDVAASATRLSTSALRSPAGEDDRLDEIYTGDGQLLGLSFDPITGDTVLRIGGTLGGEAITPSQMTVTRGLTTIGDLLGVMEDAFNISNSHGVRIHDGIVVVLGDVEMRNAIHAISIVEPGNDVSNLWRAFDFRTLQRARNAATYSVTIPVYDSQAETHQLTLEFTKRTGFNTWDWSASLDGGEEIVAGESGTISFDERGTLASFLFTDGGNVLAFRLWPPSPGEDNVVVLTIDPGAIGGSDGLSQLESGVDLSAVANGNPPRRQADLGDLRLVAPGRADFNALMHFGDVPNGTVGSNRAAVIAPAMAETRLGDVLTDLALPLESSGSNTFGLEYRAIVGGENHAGTLLQAERASTTIGDLLMALQSAVGAPDGGAVSIDADGRLLVAGRVGTENAISELQVIDPARPSGLLSLSLRFDVTAAEDPGCH